LETSNFTGWIPHFEFMRLFQKVSTVHPIGVIEPMPVTTTRRILGIGGGFVRIAFMIGGKIRKYDWMELYAITV
jgi:hypothetical protein